MFLIVDDVMRDESPENTANNQGLIAFFQGGRGSLSLHQIPGDQQSLFGFLDVKRLSGLLEQVLNLLRL